jgi:folate-binding protein YgfZ
MSELLLHEFHQRRGARFTTVNGREVVADYGDPRAEVAALHQTAGVLDFSPRSRVCLLGADRLNFLHGQVTNDVKRLAVGAGCYAALVTAKGKMVSDVNVYRLADELLLDFEPGLTQTVTQRLEKYIVADDVQVVDVAPHYGLLSVQGPRADALGTALAGELGLPATPFTSVKLAEATGGVIYLMNQPRLGTTGFDLYVPASSLRDVAERLLAAAEAIGGRACGWEAFEIARIEAGIPRFGADMDDTNLPPEAGLDTRAISYSKGCYIGQEVIARLRTYGQVTRRLRGFRLPDGLARLPRRGDPLLKDGKAVGHLTSVAHSWRLQANLALGYVRRECDELGAELIVQTEHGTVPAVLVTLPFAASTTGAECPPPSPASAAGN